MEMNGICSILRVLCVGLGLSAMLEASAQTVDQGRTGVFSSARISMTFQITSRPDSESQQIEVGEGVARIPGFLQGNLAKDLLEDGNIEFPVCIAYNNGREMTVSVDTEESTEWMLEGLNGEKIAYSVSIKGNNGEVSGKDKKVQYTPPDVGTCEIDNALKVNVTLTEQQRRQSAASLRGQFRLFISAE